MYYQHFGLSGRPFSLDSPRVTPFFSAPHREALAALEWGLREPSGFTLLVGEVGTGKTTLIHTLLCGGHEGVRAAWIANPRLSFEEMLELLAKQLDLRPARPRLLDFLQALDALLSGLKREECVAMIFDEAQALSDETLEQLRLLSNFQSARDRPLQIILVGQLELVGRLGRPELRQLNQRIGARCLLTPLRASEVRSYVDHHLRPYGSDVRKLFRRSALRALVRHSGKIPRLINVLCHDALLHAYSKGSRMVSGAHLRAAVRNYRNLLETSPGGSFAPASKVPWGALQSNGLKVSAAALALAFGVFAIHLSYSLNSWALRFERARTAMKAIVPSAGGNQSLGGEAILKPRSEKANNHSPTPAPANAPAGAIDSGESGTHKQPIREQETAVQNIAQETSRVPSPPASVDPASSIHAPGSLTSTAKRTVTILVVGKGDTLSKIAARCLGSVGSGQVRQLLKANPFIVSANLIYPGQTLRVESSGDGGVLCPAQ
jgi:type II secretory pathway predicted ATPase ExeA/LysM repeat protein